MNKVLTVSIAAYNVEKYLSETLESILNAQEVLDEIEIIIVNDGSDDSTKAISEQYCNQYPHTVKLIDKRNGGYGSTINESVRVASGKYYRLLDGDDWYETENIPSYIEYLKRHNEDMVITPYRKIDENSGVEQLIAKNASDYQEVSLYKSKDKNICMHEIAVLTDVIRKINITENCFYTDNEYVVEVLLNAQTVTYCRLPIYRYRLGNEEQSVGSEGIKKHYKDLLRVTYYTGQKIEAANIPDITALREKMGVMLWTAFLYVSLCEPYREMKKHFVELDKKIKNEMPRVYGSTMDNRHIRKLRKSHYLLVFPMYLYLKWKRR